MSAVGTQEMHASALATDAVAAAAQGWLRRWPTATFPPVLMERIPPVIDGLDQPDETRVIAAARRVAWFADAYAAGARARTGASPAPSDTVAACLNALARASTTHTLDEVLSELAPPPIDAEALILSVLGGSVIARTTR